MCVIAAVSYCRQQTALLPSPLRTPQPTGSAKGCRGPAGDIFVVALAGHNNRREQMFKCGLT